MHAVTIISERASTCQRQGQTIPCLLLEVSGIPGAGERHLIEVDEAALAHRMREYGVPQRQALRAIVREHVQRIAGLPEHPSHPWGGLRDDIAVSTL